MFVLRFVPKKYRMRLGDVKIDFQGEIRAKDQQINSFEI